MLHTPESTSQATIVRSRFAGRPSIAATGAVTTRPTIITQARTETAPISRLERDEQSVVTVQNAAAARPPIIANMPDSSLQPRAPASGARTPPRR